MSQTDRVLAALSRAGDRGITRVDFQAPDVIDGGVPILNIPARILELIRDGHLIEKAGRRNRCTVYRLASAVSSEPAPPSSPPGAGSDETADERCHCGGQFNQAQGVVPILRCRDCGRELPAAAITGQLFDTTDQEFDAMVPLSPYDQEAA